MAQETIRVNCVESVYLDESVPDGNMGKTLDLKSNSTEISSKTYINQIILLKFDIDEKIKKYKILSAKLNFNAIVEANQTFVEVTHYTLFDLNTVTEDKLSGDIYKSQFNQFVVNDNDFGTNVINTSTTNYNLETLLLDKEYPTYTNLTFDYLGMDDYKDVYTKEKFWENFKLFLQNGQAIIYVEPFYNHGYSKVTMQSSRTSSPPYLEVTVDTDYLYLETTNTGFVNQSKDFTFEWKIAPTLHLYDPMTKQITAQFRLRKKGEEQSQNSDISGETMMHTIPANTLEKTSYEWQVYVLTDDGRSTTTEWQEFSTVDGISSAKVIRPNLITLDGSVDNHFEWEHIISTGSAPRGFEIQYREGSSEWETLIDQKDTEQTYYDVPANTLPAGNLEWRVRTYNSNLSAGNWSDIASVIVRSAPPAPIITGVSSSPRPLISWQAEGQVRAEIQISGKTNAVLSAAKEYQWTDFLPDGVIVVQVRVQNLFGLWSPWASTTASIQNSPSGKIALSADVNNFAVLLSVSSQYPQNYIYRDGKLIGKAVKREESETSFFYVDYTALGSHTYYAMGVDEQSNYKESEPVSRTVLLDYGVIGEEKQPRWVALKRRRGSYPSHTIKKKYPATLVSYEGNTLPVAYVSDVLEAEHLLEFTVDKQTADNLEALAGKTVIYKDVRGDLIIGVLVSVECSRDRATDVKLSIEETQREVVKIE